MGENYITVVNPHFQDSTPLIKKSHLKDGKTKGGQSP